jgi:hypothetical protein
MIRESIATMDEATKAAFVLAFKEQFHTGLSDLPAAKHGDALTWTREWYRSRPEAAQTGETADATTGAST